MYFIKISTKSKIVYIFVFTCWCIFGFILLFSAMLMFMIFRTSTTFSLLGLNELAEPTQRNTVKSAKLVFCLTQPVSRPSARHTNTQRCESRLDDAGECITHDRIGSTHSHAKQGDAIEETSASIRKIVVNQSANVIAGKTNRTARSMRIFSTTSPPGQCTRQVFHVSGVKTILNVCTVYQI